MQICSLKVGLSSSPDSAPNLVQWSHWRLAAAQLSLCKTGFLADPLPPLLKIIPLAALTLPVPGLSLMSRLLETGAPMLTLGGLEDDPV